MSLLRGTDESCDLCYGNAGILLFLLETFYRTGEQRFLKAAKARAEFLRMHFELVQKFGLYDGIAGIAFSLSQLSRADPDYEEIANRSANRLNTESREHLPVGARIVRRPWIDLEAGRKSQEARRSFGAERADAGGSRRRTVLNSFGRVFSQDRLVRPFPGFPVVRNRAVLSRPLMRFPG
jgi:hypothetical protein